MQYCVKLLSHPSFLWIFSPRSQTKLLLFFKVASGFLFYPPCFSLIFNPVMIFYLFVKPLNNHLVIEAQKRHLAQGMTCVLLFTHNRQLRKKINLNIEILFWDRTKQRQWTFKEELWIYFNIEYLPFAEIKYKEIKSGLRFLYITAYLIVPNAMRECAEYNYELWTYFFYEGNMWIVILGINRHLMESWILCKWYCFAN